MYAPKNIISEELPTQLQDSIIIDVKSLMTISWPILIFDCPLWTEEAFY